MAPQNPYRPCAVAQPPLLAGRARVVQALENQLAYVSADGRGAQPTALWGVQGAGKSVLLHVAADAARARNEFVVVAHASAGVPLAKSLAQAFSLELRRKLPLPEAYELAVRVFRGFQLRADPEGVWSYGVSVEPARGYADSGDLKLDVPVLLRVFGEALGAEGSALLLCIDDLHLASAADLASLCAAFRELGRKSASLPVSLLVAGSQQLPVQLDDVPFRSSCPFRLVAVGALDAQDAAEAIARPARKARVRWDADALDLAVRASYGHPAFVQRIAWNAWEERADASAVSADDVRAGVVAARDAIDRAFYLPRWNAANRRERELLRAMAADDGATIASSLNERLSRDADAIAADRDNLVEAGTIWEPEPGLVAFAVPGTTDFIRRQ